MARRPRGALLPAKLSPPIILAGLSLLLATAGVVAPGSLPATPGSFELLGSYVTPASTAVAPWGPLTLVGTTRGLLVQDLRDPAAMATLADLPLGEVRGLATWGDSALVALADGGRRLVDLSDPTDPREVVLPSEYDLPNLRVAGQHYRVDFGEGRLRVARLAGTAYVPAGEVPVPGTLVALAVDGTAAYVVTRDTPPPRWDRAYTPVTVVSLADPDHPTIAKRLEPRGYQTPWEWGFERYSRLRARDGILCLLAEQMKEFVLCLDLRDLESPAYSNLLQIGQISELRGLECDGDRALVWGLYHIDGGIATSLRVVDVSDPAQLRPYADLLTAGGLASAVALQGDRVLGAGPGALRVIQVPAPATVVDRGTSYGYLAQRPCAAGDSAFYVALDGPPPSLLVFDVAAPARLAPPDTVRLTSRTVKGPISGLNAFRDAVYVGSWTGVGRLDASRRLAPVEVDYWADGGGLVRDRGSACRLARRRDDGSVDVYDVTDPLHPLLEGSTPAGSLGNYCQMSDDALFVQHARPEGGSYADIGDTIVAYSLGSPGDGLGAVCETSRLVDQYSLLRNFVVRGRHLFARGQGYNGAIDDPWYAVDLVCDFGDPAGLTKVHEGDVPRLWSSSGGAYAALGCHLQLIDDRLAAYDLAASYLDPPLIAEIALPAAGAWLAAAGDLIYAFAPGRLDVLRFRPELVPPRLALAIAADLGTPATLRVRLTADEPLAPASVALAAAGAALAVIQESPTSFLADLGTDLGGRLTIAAAASDPYGNAALAQLEVVLGVAVSAGRGVWDPATGLAIDVPAGAFAEPVRLVLVTAGDGTDAALTAALAASRAAAGDTLAFLVEPATLRPARTLALSMPVPSGTVPRLLGWSGTDYADFAVRLDRATGRATAMIDRLGRFLLLPDAEQPPVARAALEAAAPNPFNARTNLAFAVPGDGRATLRLFDVRGRLVRTLQDGPLPPGRHGYDWDGRDDGGRPLPSGPYFYRLEAGGESLTGRCALVK